VKSFVFCIKGVNVGVLAPEPMHTSIPVILKHERDINLIIVELTTHFEVNFNIYNQVAEQNN
jgi:hypothetical protein